MRVVPTTNSGPLLTRVIGSLDCKGRGTNHVLPNVNPFVLLDEAPNISVPNKPGFGLHPHSGAMILTICLTGQVENVYFAADGKQQKEVFSSAPFILGVTAGRGIVHDEHTFGDKPTKLFQLAWMTADASADAELFHQNDPVILSQDDGVKVMLCAGNFRDHASGITCKERPDLTVLLITLSPGGKFETDEFTNQEGNVFIYNTKYENRKGPVWINGEQEVLESQVVVDMPLDSKTIKIENRGTENDATLLLGFGKPFDKVWTKLLMHNGFIFAETEEDAEKKNLEFETVGAAKFGKRTLD